MDDIDQSATLILRHLFEIFEEAASSEMGPSFFCFHHILGWLFICRYWGDRLGA